MPFRTELREVQREVRVDGDATHVTYHTPAGSVSCAFTYTQEMKDAGASISWITEHAFKSVDDVPALEHIFSHLAVVPDERAFQAWSAWLGDSCAPIAFGSLAASPMHHVMRDLLPMTDFFLQMHDHPDAFAALAKSLEGHFDDVFAALVACDAPIIFMGANYDETITYPPFFDAHIAPWLARLADLAREGGKYLLTHTDGENEGLIASYRRCDFAIADSVCPAPMTKMTIEQFMTALPEMTVWGGVPSVALCPNSMSDTDFDRLIDKTVAFAAEQARLILGIADTTPANAAFGRILKVTERVNKAARS